jgi:hypothetical protein
MKLKFIIPFAMLLAVLLSFSFRHKGWTADGIIVNNADDTLTLEIGSDQTLIGLVNQVAPRFVIEYANANKFYGLTDVPSDLRILFGKISPRFVIEYANANKFYNLTVAPSELITLLGQVAPRFVLQYANANKFYTFSYPVALIGDTQAPAVSNVTVTVTGPGSVNITWVTDEYASRLVELGSTSGVYTQTAADNEFKKNHEAVFTGLIDGATYYYLIHNTDRSGNPGVTSELTFKFEEVWRVYLPFVKK